MLWMGIWSNIGGQTVESCFRCMLIGHPEGITIQIVPCPSLVHSTDSITDGEKRQACCCSSVKLMEENFSQEDKKMLYFLFFKNGHAKHLFLAIIYTPTLPNKPLTILFDISLGKNFKNPKK